MNSYDSDNNSKDGGLGLVILLGLGALALAIWACLYPLAALLAAGAWALTHVAGVSLLGELQGFNLILIHYILPTAVAIAVLWFASRWDHLLALKRGYRIARHCVRLAIFVAVAMVGHQACQQDTWNGLFDDPVRLGMGIGAGIAAHLCLWHWTWLRNNGHEFLESLGLRSKELEEDQADEVDATVF